MGSHVYDHLIVLQGLFDFCCVFRWKSLPWGIIFYLWEDFYGDDAVDFTESFLDWSGALNVVD